MNQSCKCFRLSLQAILAVAALVVIPIVSPVYSMQASAMHHADMADMNPSRNVCCSQSGGIGTVPDRLGIDEQRQAAPDPAPAVAAPFFVQFYSSFAPRSVRPAREHQLALLRPPDEPARIAVYRI